MTSDKPTGSKRAKPLSAGPTPAEGFESSIKQSSPPEDDSVAARLRYAAIIAELVTDLSVGDGWAYDVAYGPNGSITRYIERMKSGQKPEGASQ